MARKNDSRVAVTRVAPSRRPAEIVAPDRETPGMSATHWTAPIVSTCRSVRSSSSSFCRGLRSAHHITALHPMSAAETTQRLRSGPVIRSFASTATTTIGSEPAMTYQANL